MSQSRLEDIMLGQEVVPLSRVEELMGQVIDEKLDANLGEDNSGKILAIDSEGKIAPASAWGTGIVVTESVVSGEDYALTISEE